MVQKYQDLLKLFPYFEQPCVISVAKLKRGLSGPDPEDYRAAKAIKKHLIHIQGNGENVKIKYIPSISAIESDKHFIALGGYTPPNKDISYLPAYSKNMPHREIYLNVDPAMADKQITRKFLGKPQTSILKAVWDNKLGVNGKLLAEEEDGWLTKDYLLITTYHLKCLIPSAHVSRFVVSFEGLYGPGTMAVELFFREFDKKLKGSILQAIGNHSCFQILCSVWPINHSGDLSYPEDIDFVRAYPITDFLGLKDGNDSIISIQSQAPRQESRIAEKKAAKKEKLKEYELFYSGGKIKSISSEKAEEIRKRKGQKAKDEIFIDDERKEVFFNKKFIKEFQGQNYSLLRHFVGRKGIGGNKMEIYKGVWENDPDGGDDIKINRSVDTALTRFRDILQKYGIGKIPPRKDSIRKVYILSPKRAYCILRKIEDKEI